MNAVPGMEYVMPERMIFKYPEIGVCRISMRGVQRTITASQEAA
jgi:hypothetical protein